MGEEDKVFSRFTWHGTHRGEFFGAPATGKHITVKGMVVDRVVADPRWRLSLQQAISDDRTSPWRAGNGSVGQNVILHLR